MNGVRLGAQAGFNPFEVGFVGATDFHSGTSAVEENNMTSMSGDTVDATLEERLVTTDGEGATRRQYGRRHQRDLYQRRRCCDTARGLVRP